MKSLKITFLFLAFASFLTVKAQNPEQTNQLNAYLPKVDGSLKTKVEFDLENSKMRFEVRNARFGAKGNVNKYIAYRAEIDLSDEGKIKMLDAYVKITPLSNLDIYLGQRKVPFGTDYMRSPVENIFANRSFVAKYTNDGLRDIGLVVNYKFGKKMPVELWIAALNGTGNNNPQWIDRPNFAGRASLEPVKNFRITGNYYNGATTTQKDLNMFGGELRYQTDKLLVETELMKRHYFTNDSLNVETSQSGFYIHSYYNFFTGKNMIQYIAPVARYDFMGDLLNKNNLLAERITAGINFGFEPKPFKAEIRLNYEKYLKKYNDTHFDRFTIEFIAKF